MAAAVRRVTYARHWLTAGSAIPRRWRIASPGVALLALAMAVGETRAQCVRCGQSPAWPSAALWPPAVLSPPVYSAGPQRVEWSWRKQSRSGRKTATTVAGGAHTVCVRACDGAFFPRVLHRRSEPRRLARGGLPVALSQRGGGPLFVSARRHGRRGRLLDRRLLCPPAERAQVRAIV